MSVDLDICICTFRRPQLASTLRSLTGLTGVDGLSLRAVVADNDETPSARDLVESLSSSVPFPIIYVHAPARNISIARNACLNASDAPLAAFIDDDECATPGWLAALIARHHETGAGVILGPVRSRYPESASAWLREGDFHSIVPVQVQGAIVTGYTSNVLLSRQDPALAGLSFDVRLGRSGGEDTAFFTAYHAAGGRIDYAPQAVVTEDVAPQRLSLRWLVKRAFRSGQTHGMLLRAGGLGIASIAGKLAPALAKAAFCGLMAALSLLSRRRAAFWLIRGSLHAGVVARLLGVMELTQYG